MAREPIIQSSSIEKGNSSSPPQPGGQGGGFDPDDARYDDELRPQRLRDVVGQRRVVERLEIVLDAAKKRGEPLGHLLLDGPPGIGKTTLATVVPKELGGELQITSGPALSAPRDLLPYLTNASRGSVLFIDEIHRLPPAVEEFLYPAMEDFRVDIALGEGLNARTISLDLQRFTLIGATTRSGMLTAPLRDRFVIREHLEFYDDSDVEIIVTRNAKKLRSNIDPLAAKEIARRSRGTPRKANNLLRWARDFADSKADGVISHEVANRALTMLEVDDLGLERQDRRYLETLITVFTGGPAGLNAIAHTMHVSPDTLEDEVEPFLLRCGFIQRTARGRVVTAAGYQHLKLPPPKPPGQQTLF
jgi:holliday junction DNA helicase RuvB